MAGRAFFPHGSSGIEADRQTAPEKGKKRASREGGGSGKEEKTSSLNYRCTERGAAGLILMDGR